LQWMRNPTPLDKINDFQPFQCDYKVNTIRMEELYR
jgi:hypothetical protein